MDKLAKKLIRTLILVSSVTSATAVHATATGSMSGVIDWSTLSITGLLTGPVAVTFPPSLTPPGGPTSLSSDAEGYVGDESGDLDEVYAINGADALASYSDAALDLAGGYDSTIDETFGNVMITNNGPGILSGYARGWRGFFYQASGDGSVTVSVDYSLDGTVSTDSTLEYANAGYEALIEVIDADLWIAEYNTAFSTNGGDSDAAEAAADLAAALGLSLTTDFQLIDCFGNSPCTNSTASGAGGTLSLTFDVVNGRNYSFGAEIGTGVYTDVSAVPVPAAVWLFGSGLLGFVGLARRKKSV